MVSRPHLGWKIPRSPWETLEQDVLDRKGATDFYAGNKAEQIADLWLRIEETDTSPRAGHTGTPLQTKKKKVSEVPLAAQEKTEVHSRMHEGTKERLSIAASEYGVNPGVLLGYIIREYYDTNGWGYAIEAVGSIRKGTADRSAAEQTPYHESDKKDWICDQLEPGPNGIIQGEAIRELISDMGAESRTDHYLSGVLDQLDYIHHPTTPDLYIPRDRLFDDHGLTPDDPVIHRKPFKALDRTEKINGLKDVMMDPESGGMSVGEIHESIFGGNGSINHIRDLVNTVRESPGFTYRTTPSGKTKILQYSRSRSSAVSSAAANGGVDP